VTAGGDTERPAAGADPGAAPGLRADAERNRSRIIDAARSLYARGGLGVSMAAVAREAGVGKATLSRHFASPQDLIQAVFADRMAAYGDATTAALAEDDPWQSFVRFVGTVCQMQADDRGFADLLTLTFRAAGTFEADRERAYRAFLTVIKRAKGTGHLRADFESEDLVVLLLANAGVVAATAQDAPDAWRRLLAQMLRGYASPDAPLPPMPPAPTSADLYKAMTRTAPRTDGQTTTP
jgi:AcrR family transcriptional regulator